MKPQFPFFRSSFCCTIFLILFSIITIAQTTNQESTTLDKFTKQNILTNPGFESWTNGSPYGWFGSRTNLTATNVVQSTNSHSGSYACQLINTESNHKRFSSGPLNVVAGQTYDVTFWVRGNGDIRTGFWDGLGTDGVNYVFNDYISVSNVWTQHEQSVVAPATVSNAELIFSIRNTTGNHIFIDDVTTDGMTFLDVDFIADKTFASIGATINFTDLSTGSPTTWNWTITGPETKSSTQKNPSFTFLQAGSYTVKLGVSNTTDSGEEIKQNYITITSSQISTWDGNYIPFTNGSGTESNPYLIENAAHLAYLAYLVNNGVGAGSGNIVGANTYYKMTINVDLNGSDAFQWTPIGYYNSDADQYFFGGHFDGSGHAIANLWINNTTLKRGGLFGQVSGGSIRNVGITGNSSINISLVSNDKYAGGITGYYTGIGILDNCYNTGNISSYLYSGGIVGRSACNSSSDNLTITNCFNTGKVSSSSSSSFSGGIVGYHYTGTLFINNSYNKGNVFSSSYSGGITGSSTGTLTITNCYNTGNVSSSRSAGIVGYRNSETSSISNSYNIGQAGHAISGSSGTISNCYYLNTCSSNNNNGGISKTADFMKSAEMVPLLGYAFKQDTPPYQNDGYPIHSGINISLATKDASNITQTSAILNGEYSAGGTTITSKGFEYKLATASNYTPVTVSGSSLTYNLTGLSQGMAYQFRAFITGPKIGTLYGNVLSFNTLSDNIPWDGITITPVTPDGDSYYIYAPAELAWIAQQCNNGNNFGGKSIVLLDNLNLGGALPSPSTWIPIGNANHSFNGTFEGNHYTISNLYHNAPGNDYVGLFGNAAGSLKNIILHNIQLTGKANVGGVAGRSSYIEGCYANGTIEGSSNVGGIVGNANSSVRNCYYNGCVTGLNYVGGLIGAVTSSSAINSCYATGSVNGDTYVGGLIGGNINYNTINITNSYSTATLNGYTAVGGIIGNRISSNITFTNCYFDQQMAGISFGAGSGAETGISGKLTTEMTTSSGFGLGNPKEWSYANGLYPQLAIFATHEKQTVQKASQLSAAPAFLQNGESSAAVSSDFTLSVVNGVTWRSGTPSVIGINGTNAKVNPVVLDNMVSLYATLNGLEKEIRLNVVGGDTILIYSKEELLLVANQCNNGSTYEGKYIKLMNNIVLEENMPNNMISIGNYEEGKPFMGTFNGNGKVIKNVYIDKPNNPYQGFFGYTVSANLYEVGLINITASGRNYTGGLVAYAENTYLRDCYVDEGNLHALTYVGGLVGYQSPGSNSVISGCYNTCTVSANAYVGGLVGYSDQATVRNSYVTSKVEGQDVFTTGALIGGANQVLMYNCYFSIELTGQTEAIGENITKSGEGMSNAEMQTAEFIEKLNKGLTKAVWREDYEAPINDNFPILIWQRNNDACAEPANLMVNEVKIMEATLSWQGGSDDHYQVEYARAGGYPKVQTTTKTSITLTDLEPSTEYIWRVRSVCSFGESNLIQGANFTTGATSISNLQKDDVRVYPNPATDKIHISSQESAIRQIVLFNQIGQQIMETTISDINLSGLPSGLYILRVMTDKGIVNRKVIKQ